jgi:hypothetical protein
LCVGKNWKQNLQDCYQEKSSGGRQKKKRTVVTHRTFFYGLDGHR